MESYTPSQALDAVAEKLRLAYAEADDRHRQHIQDNPWETLPEARKYKWRFMASEALDLIAGVAIEVESSDG